MRTIHHVLSAQQDAERDATEADVLRPTGVKHHGVFIDRRAADPPDGTVLLTEWGDEEEDCLLTRMRLPPSEVMNVACNLSICNANLIDFERGSVGGDLEYDLSVHGPLCPPSQDGPMDTFHL